MKVCEVVAARFAILECRGAIVFLHFLQRAGMDIEYKTYVRFECPKTAKVSG